MHDSHYFGFESSLSESGHSSSPSLNWKVMKKNRDDYVTRLNGIYKNNIANSGVTLLTGEASFVDSKKVLIGGKEYSAKHIIIAVGGVPLLPDIEGKEHMITSDGFLL